MLKPTLESGRKNEKQELRLQALHAVVRTWFDCDIPNLASMGDRLPATSEQTAKSRRNDPSVPVNKVILVLWVRLCLGGALLGSVGAFQEMYPAASTDGNNRKPHSLIGSFDLEAKTLDDLPFPNWGPHSQGTPPVSEAVQSMIKESWEQAFIPYFSQW